MATIRATCADCGDVELTTADVVARVCLDEDTGDYRFRCPKCEMVVIKAAEPRIVDLLVASGCELQIWRLPVETCQSPHTGRLTVDDQIDFHELLSDDNKVRTAVEELVGEAPRGNRAREGT